MYYKDFYNQQPPLRYKGGHENYGTPPTMIDNIKTFLSNQWTISVIIVLIIIGIIAIIYIKYKPSLPFKTFSYH